MTASAIDSHVLRSVKTFTYNRMNLTNVDKLHKEIADFTTGKKVLDYSVDNRFMNITVKIIVEEVVPVPKVFAPKEEYVSSEYKGVHWNKRDKKWRVEITVRNRRHYLGQYASEVEAANVYDRKALELLGSKAKLNFESEVVLNG